jgi:bacterioferritin (cytochrome b1)
MKKIGHIIGTTADTIKLLNIALEHEWAVSFEYLLHAYSMPKGKFFYEDPVMKQMTDARAQTIQIGVDEMYHALQLGIIITQMGGVPSFKTDDVIRYPKIIDNLKRDKATEDLVTDLYQTARFKKGAYPRVLNMILNISYDEVRHSRQFEVMIETLAKHGHGEALCFQADPEVDQRQDTALLHEIMRHENELMHRYLKYVILFSDHQDLSQRLFKNSINHMRHWDKNAGLLVKMGSVIRIENAEKGPSGEEKSRCPMLVSYAGRSRLSALKTLVPAEQNLITRYEQLIAMVPDGEIKVELGLHLALKREHLFTQEWLLTDARLIKSLD